MASTTKLLYRDVYECDINQLFDCGEVIRGFDGISPTPQKKGGALVPEFVQWGMRTTNRGCCLRNGIEKHHIIVVQNGSAILSSEITNRDIISTAARIKLLILSVDRQKWLKIYANLRIETWGVPNDLFNPAILGLFTNLDTTSKRSLVSTAMGIRDAVIRGTEKSWYVLKSDDRTLIIPIVGEGLVRINESALMSIQLDDIDRLYIWDNYMWVFAQSILVMTMNTKEFSI